MRILIVSPRTSGIGGIAYHVSKLVEHLARRGIEVETISVENTPFINVKGLMNPSFAISSSVKALMLRISRGFDVVHAHNIPSALPMRMLGCRRVLTLHGVYSEQVHVLHGGLMGILSEAFEAKTVGWAHALTVVSRSTMEFYRRRGFKPVLIPNAIDFDDLPRERETLFENQVTYVGRLSYEKGVDLLVKVAVRLPELNFVLIGDGPLRRMLHEASGGTSNLHVLGYMRRREALRHLAGSRAFILPSRKEGLSTSILEAMALRIPVVATSTGGNVELVSDGETGYLAEAGNVGSIVAALRRAINGHGETVGKAYEMVSRVYNWRNVAGMYLSLYEAMRAFNTPPGGS
ncbi:MAG: glycosyltransferase family 4 protein [Thermoproteota archaeon]